MGVRFFFSFLVFVEKQQCDKHKCYVFKERRSSNGIKFLLCKYVNWNLRFDIFIFSHRQEEKTFALSMHFGHSFNLNHPSDCETQWKPAIFSMLNEGTNELVKRRIKEEKKKKRMKTMILFIACGSQFQDINGQCILLFGVGVLTFSFSLLLLFFPSVAPVSRVIFI